MGKIMTDDQLLRECFVSLEVNEGFTESILAMRDRSRLCFCHRVSERWVKALAADPAGSEPNLASRVLSLISLFRLNAKHLDIQFRDGSRWELNIKMFGVQAK